MHEQNHAETVTKMHIFFCYCCCLPKALISLLIYFLGKAGWLANTSKLIYPFVSSGNFEKEITSSGLNCKILASLDVVFRKYFFFFGEAGG